MRGDARLVRDLRIGPELRAPFRTRPLLSGVDERAADAAASCVRRHIPAFQIADAARPAPIDDVPEGELDEADRAAVLPGKQNFGRLAPVAAEEPVDVGRVIRRGVRPQRTSERDPYLPVRA